MSKEKVVRKPVEKIKPGQIVLFVVTILLAILFLYPVFFALISAFKSNGDILKNPIALPTSFYTQNFKDLFAQSDFATAILHSVFLTVVSEVLIVCIVPMAAYGIERRKSKTTSLIYTYFLAGMMIPFHLYMFPLFKEMKVFHISAFKSNGDILKNPIALPTSFYTQNFKDLFAQSDFATAILHSVFLTVVSEVLIVCIVPMAAYGIERRKSKTTSLIYTYFLAGMMIPFHLYMFPLFKEMKVFHIFGNMVGPIVCYISGSIAFGTLLYCSFLKGIPLEIEEAAQIDGCTPFQTFWKVTFPLLGPCTGSMVILNGLGIWNDYLMPYLALPSGKAKTITVEIASFVGQYTARWDIVFAGTVISIVPALIIFCMFQKYFVKGITAGAAKG